MATGRKYPFVAFTSGACTSGGTSGACTPRSIGRCSSGVSGLWLWRSSRTSGSVVRCSSRASDRWRLEARTPTVRGCSAEMDNPRLQETAGSPEPVDSCAAEINALRLQEIETCQSRCLCANEENTCHSRRVATTSMVLGRRPGSCSQHRTVMSQTGSVKSCRCGRPGISRSSNILRVASGGARSLSGRLAVNTLSRFNSKQTVNLSTPYAWHNSATD